MHSILPKSTWPDWDQVLEFWIVLYIVCHQDVFPSIRLDPEAKHMKEHRDVFLDLDGSSKRCQMGVLCWLICYYSSCYWFLWLATRCLSIWNELQHEIIACRNIWVRTYSSHMGFRWVIIWSLFNSMKESITLYSCRPFSCIVSTFFILVTPSLGTPSWFLCIFDISSRYFLPLLGILLSFWLFSFTLSSLLFTSAHLSSLLCAFLPFFVTLDVLFLPSFLPLMP